jgi:hypothetical protein
MAAKNIKKVTAPVVEIAPVTEAELSQLMADRQSVKDLSASVTATKKRLEAQEAAIIARLRNGAKVQGSLVAVVNMVKGRCALSWKDMCQKVCLQFGKDFNAFEAEEKKAKSDSMQEEAELVVTKNAIEQYKAV